MLKKIIIFLNMIKIEHTLFALPFAYMGALLGGVVELQKLPSWEQVGWVTLAMVGARSAAMGLNRLIDRTIDGKNPRTAMRAIPAGLLAAKEVILFVIAAFILLFVAAQQLSELAFRLLPVAVFFLVLYSYTKRFTWLCHIILGLTIGLAPLGGWVAISGHFSTAAIIFYLTIALWTAGFDIIYACQDYAFDLQHKLHSIPVRFGINGSLFIAKLLHGLTIAGFIALYFVTELSWIYAIGTLISASILIYEHSIVSAKDLSRTNTAFFTMNGALSIVMFTFGLLDLVILWH